MIRHDDGGSKPETAQAHLSAAGACPQSRNTSPPSAPASKAALYSSPDARPVMLPVLWDRIPASLRALKQWVIWCLEWKGTKWNKVPKQAKRLKNGNGFYGAASTKPQHWSEFKSLRYPFEPHHALVNGVPTKFVTPDGIGLVFTKGGNLFGIDLDDCRNHDTGELSPLARQLVARLPGYWEVSPSRTGIKGIFFGVLPEWLKDRQTELEAGQSVEVYEWGRYFALTGHTIAEATADVTAAVELDALLADLFPPQRQVEQPAAEPLAGDTPRAERSTRKPVSRGDRESVSLADRIRRARGYLANCPPAIQGVHVDGKKGEHRTIYTAGQLVRGFDLTPDQAFPLFADWNRNCVPRWDDERLMRKLREADKHPGERGYLLKVNRGSTDLTADKLKILVATETTPVAPPEPCAYAAATDVRELLTPTCCKNPAWFLCERQKTGKRGNLPFGCHKPGCVPCLSQKLSDEFNRTADWLIRQVQPENPTGQMMLCGAVVSPDDKGRIIEAVQRRGGVYNWTDTTDAEGCNAHLNQPETADAVLKAPQKESAGIKCRTLFLALVPVGESAPAGLSTITAAGALRAKGNALQTTPPRPEGAERHRVYGQSHRWGEKPEKKSSDIKIKRPSLFGGRVTEEIVGDEWGIGNVFHTDDRRIQGNPVGFDAGSRLRNLAAELLLAGTGAPAVPNKDFVIQMGRHWFPKLTAEVGDGPNVERVLLKHLWHLRLYSIDEELLTADKQDRDDADAKAERHETLTGIRRGQPWKQPDVEHVIQAGLRLISHVERTTDNHRALVRLSGRVRRAVLQRIPERLKGVIAEQHVREARRYARAMLRAH